MKALEDKTYRGATIASPSIPWGGGPNANEPTISGYHAVWAAIFIRWPPRFWQWAIAPSANRALDYLFNMQQKTDGSFPQNSGVGGVVGGGLQMDQVALPLVSLINLSALIEPPGSSTSSRPLILFFQGPGHRSGSLGREARLFAGNHRRRDCRFGLRCRDCPWAARSRLGQSLQRIPNRRSRRQWLTVKIRASLPSVPERWPGHGPE